LPKNPFSPKLPVIMSSRISSLLFPSSPRSLRYNRGISIVLRTLHLLTSGLLLGGHAFDVEPERLVLFLYLTVGSGVGLILLELYRSCDWAYQGMGALVILKVVLTGMAGIWWAQRLPLLCLVAILGSVGSHMPARYRHYSLLHGRVVPDHGSPPQPPTPNP
jgi:hypothetical protein